MHIHLATSVSEGKAEGSKLEVSGICQRIGKFGMSLTLELHVTDEDDSTISMNGVIAKIRDLHQKGGKLTILVLESE